MIKVILSIVCFLNIAAFAQTISGTVKDADTKLPLSGILVTNGEDVVKTDAKALTLYSKETILVLYQL